jgi:hypothetical protein
VKTVGISPKAWVPAVAAVVVGVVLLVLGYDVEGRSAILAGVGQFAIAFGVAPGLVVGPTDPEPPPRR